MLNCLARRRVRPDWPYAGELQVLEPDSKFLTGIDELERSDCHLLYTVCRKGQTTSLRVTRVTPELPARMQGHGQLGVLGGVCFGHWAWASVYATCDPHVLLVQQKYISAPDALLPGSNIGDHAR
jgi:hypothetical protein